MKKWLHKIELAVDWLIPWLIVLLLFIIISELFFHDFAVKYHTLISVLDGIVIFVFVLDLIFKYIRIRNIKKFFRTCWLELEKSGVKLVEEGSKLIQEAEKAGKVSRVKKILRFFKPIARSPKFLKALPFYETPTGKHHLHDPEREFEEAFEGLEKEEKKVKKFLKKKLHK